MTKVKLTMGERFMVNRIINEKGGHLTFGGLKTSLKIAEKTSVDEKERKKAKFTEDKITGNATWNEKGSEKEIEFSQDEHKLLLEFIDSRSEEKKFSVKEGRFMVDLVDKLNEAKDE